jgi:hypothetical protein
VTIPEYLREKPALAFVDSRVAVRSAIRSLLVDTRQKTVGAVTGDISTRLDREDQDRQKIQQAKERTQDVVRRFGAREGVTWPE